MNTDWPNERDRVEIRIILPVSDTDELRPLADKARQAISDNATRLFGLREWHMTVNYHLVSGDWTPHADRHLSVVPDPGDVPA